MDGTGRARVGCMTLSGSKAVRFAEHMKRIPRKALRCPVYGTMHVVVDEPHAKNIILKHGDPAATASDIYDAMRVLQDRLDAHGGVS